MSGCSADYEVVRPRSNGRGRWLNNNISGLMVVERGECECEDDDVKFWDSSDCGSSCSALL